MPSSTTFNSNIGPRSIAMNEISQHNESHQSHHASQEKSFFERLPYDIRLIVYENLEPGDLPPFTRGFQPSTSGFLLSCRQAKQDLEDLASLGLSKYLVEFTDSFKTSIKIDAKFATSLTAPLRHITVTIPFTAIDSFLSKSVKATWRREILVGLHPLLSLHFDVVRVHFLGTENQPPHESSLDRGTIEVSMHSLLRDVMYMIERVNKKRPEQDGGINRLVSVTSIFKYVPGRREEAYPDANVNAARICLSWDLRAETTTDKETTVDTFNGKMYRDQIPDTGRVNSPKPGKAPFFYHLRDGQRLAGEMGVVSCSRWRLADNPRIVAFLNCIDTRVQYCSCDGFGAELGEGLHGVGEKEFEESEEEVGGLIYA